MLSERDLLRSNALMGTVRASVVAAIVLATGANDACAQCETAKLMKSPIPSPDH